MRWEKDIGHMRDDTCIQNFSAETCLDSFKHAGVDERIILRKKRCFESSFSPLRGVVRFVWRNRSTFPYDLQIYHNKYHTYNQFLPG